MEEGATNTFLIIAGAILMVSLLTMFGTWYFLHFQAWKSLHKQFPGDEKTLRESDAVKLFVHRLVFSHLILNAYFGRFYRVDSGFLFNPARPRDCCVFLPDDKIVVSSYGDHWIMIRSKSSPELTLVVDRWEGNESSSAVVSGKAAESSEIRT